MTYLYVLYARFDISIIKLVTLEDILATPIKNPNIIFIFIGCIFVFYLIDAGNRFNARLNIKYSEKDKPWYFPIIRTLVWTPKSRKVNQRLTAAMMFVFLSLYVVIFANNEAKLIKKGEGNKIELSVADTESVQVVSLLGTTSQFVLVYDENQQRAIIYQVESVSRMTPTTNLD